MNTNISDIEWIQKEHPAPDPNAAGTGSCPSHEKLWAAAEGSLPRQEWRDIFEHTLECELCADGWRLARHLGARPEVPVARRYVLEIESDWETVKERCAALLRSLKKLLMKPSKGFGPHLWALAVLIVVAVGVSPTFFRSLSPAANDPATPETGALRGEIRSSLSGKEPLPRDRFVLEWTGGPADARYRVEVMTEDLRLIDRVSGLEASAYQVPAEKLRDVSSGETLLWQVTPLPRDTRSSHFETFRTRVE